jgi:hypothetical protein
VVMTEMTDRGEDDACQEAQYGSHGNAQGLH